MHCLPLVLIFTLSAASSSKGQQAQERTQLNSVFLELGGNGGFYSVNYDRRLLWAGGWSLAGRVGTMYYSSASGRAEGGRSVWLAAPLEVSWLRGKGNHLLEMGLGVTSLYLKYPEEESSQGKELRLLPVGRVGYRFQQREGGMFYKAGFTPMAQFSGGRRLGATMFLPWFGLAVGYTLKM